MNDTSWRGASDNNLRHADKKDQCFYVTTHHKEVSKLDKNKMMMEDKDRLADALFTK